MKTRMGNLILGAMLAILLTAGLGHADLNTGLVAYYPFDGNANETSGNPAASDGTEYGGPSYVSGVLGDAIKFDGVDAWVGATCQDIIVAGTQGSFAISFWFKPTSTWIEGGSGYPNDILVANVDHGIGADWLVSCGGSTSHGRLQFRMDDDDWWANPPLELYTITNVWHAETWYNIVYSHDASTRVLSVWVNGTFENNTTIPLNLGRNAGGEHLSIGRYNNDYIDMTFDELRLYNRALSESEIQQLAGTAEPTPAEQIQEILEFVYHAVTDGTIVGVGAPTAAKNKLQDWIAKLQYARNLAEAGSLAEAYVWLEDAYKLADGDIRPPDHVRGSAVPQVAEDLKALLDELTPELEFEFASSTGNALVYSIPISVADRRMGKALAEEALNVTENALKFLINPKNKVNPWFFIADVLVLVSELYDPVTVAPVGPNMDLTRDNEILATVSPATGNNEYSGIVVLDLLGTGWTEEDAARVNSGLTLRAENRYGTEFYESIALLTKEEIKSLNPNRCYVIAPKSYFQATWAAPTYVFLNAFYQYGLGEHDDIEPILIQPD